MLYWKKKKFHPSVIFIIVLLFLPNPGIQATEKTEEELPKFYKKWFEEEVAYIITPKEKEVFLQLKTDRERKLFIDAFWKHRDPNLNSEENEFRKEHYRRIVYVNQWFGRESPLPGWKTDMGRIYIILGEPNSIERFENLTEVYPTVIWFYQGKGDYGLPNAFNVVFFKRSGFGEYELYTPIKFGPQYLLIHYQGDLIDHQAAFYELLDVEPAIAGVSLTLLPEESMRSSLFPSLASELLVYNRIPAAPHKKVEDSYAEKLLKYKDIIEVEYTANYIGNDASVHVIKDKSGIHFVHFIVEPKKLTFEKSGDKFHARLEISGRVSDNKGNTVFQYQRTIPVEFNQEQFNDIKAKLFSFQDMIPLIEGDYELSLLLKNTVSKEFTSVEASITIPEEPSLQMSSLVLANKIIKDSKYGGKNKPYLFENIQLVPSPRNDFSKVDILYLFLQVYDLDEHLKNTGFLEFSIHKGDEKVHSAIKEIRNYLDTDTILEEFSLANFVPAYYKLKVSLLNDKKEEMLSQESYFYISPVSFLPRPWVLSVPMESSNNPV
jgi:GWxTD domain-containing protein